MPRPWKSCRRLYLPEHRPDKATYTPYDPDDPDDPETRAFIERVLEARLARLERFVRGEGDMNIRVAITDNERLANHIMNDLMGGLSDRFKNLKTRTSGLKP